MARVVETIESFAKTIHKLLLSDRDGMIGVAGMTGEGKSTFLTKLQKAHAKISGQDWGFDRMTWSRKELLKWIDGDKDGKGQLPEYSAILVDELFSMFYRRNWYDEAQIDAIATFNMCRDRHLFIGGNVPDLWELDGGFLNRLRFYVFIPIRGVAWVFQPENNPFTNDKWNMLQNKKEFRKKRNPYSIPNFVCEIHFDDWDAEEKKEYYRIRNIKRVKAISDNKNNKKERYTQIKAQRDTLIKMMLCINNTCPECKHEFNTKFTNKDISEAVGITQAAVSLIRNGMM